MTVDPEKQTKRNNVLTSYEAALVASLEIQQAVLPNFTPESVQSGAATILIQWERNRCL